MRRASPAPRIVVLNAPKGLPIRTDAHGTPLALQRDRRWIPVASVQESWRIDDEWWRVPIRRIYHRILLADGRLLTAYHDLEAGGWFEQR